MAYRTLRNETKWYFAKWYLANDIYPVQGLGSEYFEADRDRSASLRLFISCQQNKNSRQRLNEKIIRATDNQSTAI